MYVNVIDGVRSRIGKSEKLYGPANGPAGPAFSPGAIGIAY